ncbi:protease Do-like 2, chloroplastic isoform X2 [Nicotiana tabacum]|uniref:Protease Do-like 2, chloroplastic isoform X2 n=1 Tax=Nicotiana tabacum TaxID=4097 RepID=A0AC58TNA7_TOBAC
MAVATANSWFTVLTSTGGGTSRCSLSSDRLFSTSLRPSSFFLPKASTQNQNHNKNVLKKSSEKEAGKQKFPRRSKNEGAFANADDRSSTNEAGRSQPTSIKSFGLQRKGKGVLLDSKEQQVETSSFQDAAFLNAVVKVYCTHTAPDYSLPWQKQRQYTSTGSAFMIGDGKLLTNAHCVEHDTQVKVKKRGDDTKYVAKVIVAVLHSMMMEIALEWHFRSDDAENIGYVIPTTVVSHFLEDYERNGKYCGFPCLGVLLQKLENPALRACLKVPSNEGVLVRKVEPTSDVSNVLKEGDVIVSFDGVRVGSEGTVPFRSSERIAFRYLISQKFSGDSVELGIIRAGEFMKVQAVLKPRVHLVPYHIEGGQPSYLIVAGLVFTPLSEPLIEEEEDSIGLKLLTKARYSLAKFEGQQIVVLSQVLANEVNIGYEDMSNDQVLKLNGTRIKNIHHLAHLVDSCKGKYLVFEFEDNFLVVLEREAALDASSSILKDYGIPAERSSDLMGAYVDSIEHSEATNQQNFGDSPVSNLEFGSEGLLWA